MEMMQTQQQPELTGNVLFYSKPEPLSLEMHGHKGVNRMAKPYGFASGAHVVPLTVAEFAPASLSYPIIFLGDEKTPLAVMGLRSGENLFVTPQGEFRPDAYIPAFVRRYPFVFANDDQAERMVLCVDSNASFVSDKPEVPFFENGQPSDYTKNAIEFCNNFETERRRTEQFVNMLKELDLFDVREAVWTPRGEDGQPGEPQKLADYYAVSEDKLKALPNDKFIELRDNGALGQIYAHLVSLLGWDKLIILALTQNVQAPVGNA